MKTLHTLIIFLFFITSSSYRSHAQDLACFFYDVDSKTNLADILLTNDGNMLITGFTTGASESYFIGKYSLNGVEIWSHRKQKNVESGNYRAGSLLQTVGGYYNTHFINKKGIMARYSIEGELMWERTFLMGSNSHIPRMLLEASAVSSNDRILAAGQSGDGWGNECSVAYVSIDTNGNNEKVHWIGQQKELNVVGIIPNQTGGSWLFCNSGNKFQSSSTGGDTYPQVYSINQYDEAVDLTKIILPFDAKATSVIMATDHHFVITGYGTDSAFVLKIDTLLNVKWIKTMALKTFSPTISMQTVKELPNGNYAICATRAITFETAAPILMELDGAGNLVWEKEMELHVLIATQFSRIINLPSGNLLWCGETYDQNTFNQSVIFMESDTEGNTFCGTIEGTLTLHNSEVKLLKNDTPTAVLYNYYFGTNKDVEVYNPLLQPGLCPGGEIFTGIATGLQQEPEVAVYPNPATTEIYIQCTGMQQCTISVYNVLGGLVMERLNPEDVPLEVSGLENGIYFFRMESAGRNFEGKFHVQH
ncbi:MAG TPA: T9SS type A sorting domain-containing protein [Chitinophagales bacterium]|nr:T9SS type A sorting domain-containing protein [Chitinophagales bacterium]